MDKERKEFYRHIYHQGNGYRIIYHGEHYGWYDDLPTCLYDRDRLEQAEWDIQTWAEMPEVPNPYEHITLPPFEKSDRYIQYIPARYRVSRRIDGKVRYYGEYETLEEAMDRRDYLLKTVWSEIT